MLLPETSLSAAVLNAIPSPVFVVDRDVKIFEANLAARSLVGEHAESVYRTRGGEALRCIHSLEGCGQSPFCSSCEVRNAVNGTFANQSVTRRAARMMLEGKGGTREAYLLVTTAPLCFEGRQYAILILEDINELVQLKRLIPICAGCKKIRNEQEYWDSLEEYFKAHLDLDFTHGLCPECAGRLYPGL